MATKTKSKSNIHQAIDFSGADPRLVDAVMDGKPLICIRDLGSRDGKRYERGDEIILGKYKNDGVYLRPHPLGGRPWVTTPEAYRHSKFDQVQKKFNRDVIEPLEMRHSRAVRNHTQSQAKLDAARAQVKHLTTETRHLLSAQNDLNNELEEARKNAPKLEDF